MSGTYNLRAAGLRPMAMGVYTDALLGLQNCQLRVTSTGGYNSLSPLTNINGDASLTGLANSTYTVIEEVAPPLYQPILSMWTGSVTSPPTVQVPYQDQQSITNGNKTRTSRQLVYQHDNNPLPDCGGLRISLVIDTSGSIDAGELAQMKIACTAFVNSMAATGDAMMPTQIAVISFDTTATLRLNWTTITTSINPSGATTVNNAINALTTGTFTNWDAAFRLVALLNPSSDVVVFLTDGNPTAYGVTNVTSGTNITLSTIENAVASANIVKSINNRMTKVIGVGIGNDLTVGNIKLVSGPNFNDDYYTAASFGTLIDTLNSIAVQLCGTPICFRRDTLVYLVDGREVFVQDLLSGQYLFDYRNNPVEVVSVIKTGKTCDFIHLINKDLYIVPGHPTLLGGQEVLVEQQPESFRVRFEERQDIYTICTRNRTFVNIQGIQVGTWSEDAWENFICNDTIGKRIVFE